jgi:hypothetical protein
VTDTPIESRTFTDDEVREILRKAVEALPSRALVRSDGVSLDELKSIAEEAGLDPARVEDAARSVVLQRGNRPNRILGAPMVLNFERRVQGTYSQADTPEILAVIRRTTGQQGEVDDIHGSLEWSARSDAAERLVTLSEKNGTTTIQSSANLTNLAVLTYVPAGVLGFLISMVGLIRFAKTGNELGLVVFFAVLPILYPVLRTIMSSFSKREAERLERVTDELARLTAVSGQL